MCFGNVLTCVLAMPHVCGIARPDSWRNHTFPLLRAHHWASRLLPLLNAFVKNLPNETFNNYSTQRSGFDIYTNNFLLTTFPHPPPRPHFFPSFPSPFPSFLLQQGLAMKLKLTWNLQLLPAKCMCTIMPLWCRV